MDVWNEIEQTLINLYSLPHNRFWLQRNDDTPQTAAKKKVNQIKSGMNSVVPQDFVGPKLFLRAVGPAPENQVYSGEWWFDVSLLDSLDSAYSRIYFTAPDKKHALRNMLRELLAIPNEINRILEIWALAVPPGEMIRGYTGPGNPQKLFANLPLTAKGNRMLVGKASQFFFPVKNPLWVQQYRNLGS